MKKIVAATNNKGKLKEFRELLKDLPVEILSLSEMGLDMEIEEDGKTFEDNAKIKSVAVFKATGLCAIGDDSGLCVDALDGMPGVYSARFAGENASDKDRNTLLLKKMEEVKEQDRGAKFVSAISWTTEEGETYVVRGECKGEILFEPKGENGFGYDPLFYVEEFDKTFGEMTDNEKNQISHRAMAMAKFKKEFEKYSEVE